MKWVKFVDAKRASQLRFHRGWAVVMPWPAQDGFYWKIYTRNIIVESRKRFLNMEIAQIQAERYIQKLNLK